ncbi:MAG: polysaccharide deacetylase family protein [Chitinivibrionales bacterium]|nr:polysaccharide deacetylase family protein [Chitinivibrionales bacterium]
MSTHRLRPDRLVSLLLMRSGLAAKPRPASSVPILMYHSISDEPEPGVSPYYRLHTPRQRFVEQLRLLREWGFTGVPLHAAASMPPAGKADGQPVVITFDDGFRDFVEHAAPVLSAEGFGATIYLVTGPTERAEAFNGKALLSWHDARQLVQAGFQIGSHTVSHPVLTALPREQVAREISDSKDRIEQRIGQAVVSFSYPYRFPEQRTGFVAMLRGLLRDAGYREGVTTRIGVSGPDDDPLFRRRLPVNGADDAALLRAKVSGAYDWLYAVQKAVKMMRPAHSRKDS